MMNRVELKDEMLVKCNGGFDVKSDPQDMWKCFKTGSGLFGGKIADKAKEAYNVTRAAADYGVKTIKGWFTSIFG